MKRSMFRLLTGSLIIFVLAASDGLVLAQGNGNGNGNGGGGGPSFSPSPFQYRLEVLYNPTGMSNTNIFCEDFKDLGNGEDIGIIAVGRYRPNDERQRGFIYDLRDPQNKVFIDAEDLFGIVDNYYVSSFQGITPDGIVVGAARDNDTGDGQKGIWFDLNENPPTLHFLEDQFPTLAVGKHYATDVNSNGDMLVYAYVQSSGPLAFVVNPLPLQEELITLDFGNSGEINRPEAINDFRQVVGEIGGVVYRHDANANATETFPDLENVNNINNIGEFCGAYNNYSGNPPNQVDWRAYRYGNQLNWLSDPIGRSDTAWGGRSVNDAGNVAYEMWLNDIPDIGVLYHSGLNQHYLIRDLVEDPLFNAADTATWKLILSNTSPTPIIAGHVRYEHDYYGGSDTAGGGLLFDS